MRCAKAKSRCEFVASGLRSVGPVGAHGMDTGFASLPCQDLTRVVCRVSAGMFTTVLDRHLDVLYKKGEHAQTMRHCASAALSATSATSQVALCLSFFFLLVHRLQSATDILLLVQLEPCSRAELDAADKDTFCPLVHRAGRCTLASCTAPSRYARVVPMRSATARTVFSDKTTNRTQCRPCCLTVVLVASRHALQFVCLRRVHGRTGGQPTLVSSTHQPRSAHSGKCRRRTGTRLVGFGRKFVMLSASPSATAKSFSVKSSPAPPTR